MKHGNGRLLVEAFGYAPYFKLLDKPEFEDVSNNTCHCELAQQAWQSPEYNRGICKREIATSLRSSQ
jgi:hypothetical protein